MLRNYSPRIIASTQAGIVSVLFVPVIPVYLEGSVLKEEQGQSSEYGFCSWIPESKSWHCWTSVLVTLTRYLT